MRIKRLVLGEFETNCYLVSSETSSQCVVIDPADSGDQIIRAIETIGTVPAAVLLTHGHWDHTLATPDLQRHWPELPVYCHPLDCPAELVEYDMGREFPTVSAFRNLHPLADGQTLSLADITIQVIHTPGHTPGSVSLTAECALFTGDTLFYGDIGRTDFAGGSYPQIINSLRRLAELPGDYRVFPGHGEATSLERERRFNPYVKDAVKGGATW